MKNVILIFLVLGFFACKTDKVGKQDTTLDIRIKSDPQKLNPMLSLGQVSRFVHQYIYLPLADYHPETLQLYPILIEDIPEKKDISDTSYSYTFSFKEGVEWHDNTPINAEDYLFTIKFMSLSLINSSAYSVYISNIDQVEKATEKSVTVTFNKPYIHALESSINIPILPRHIYDPEDVFGSLTLDEVRAYDKVEQLSPELGALVDGFNGSTYTRDILLNNGPYQLVSWEANQNIVIKRVEDYWGAAYADNPFLQQGPEEMIFYIVPDATSALSMLKEGSIDVSNEIPTTEYAKIKENAVYQDSLSFYTTPMMRYYFLQLNNGHPILKDVKVRKAMNYLLDVDAIINSLEEGMGTRLNVPVHPSKRYYDSDTPLYSKNIDRAKELLKEAGWIDVDQDGDLDKNIDGKMEECNIEMYITRAALGRNIGLLLQEACKEVGINLSLITKEYATIRDQHLKTRDYGIATAVTSLDLEDDDFYVIWHSDNDTATGRNRMSYNNPRIDELIEMIRSTPDSKVREKLYEEVQDIFYADAPGIFLYAPMEKLIINKRWNGSSTIKRPGYLGNTFQPRS